MQALQTALSRVQTVPGSSGSVERLPQALGALIEHTCELAYLPRRKAHPGRFGPDKRGLRKRRTEEK